MQIAILRAMNVTITPVLNDAYKSLTYVVSVAGSQDVLVVDPGEQVERLATVLDTFGWQPQFIVLTHEHLDHIMGTNALKLKYRGASLVCSATCAGNIVDDRMNLSFFTATPYESVPADVAITDEEYLNWHLPVMCKPFGGHSRGGMLIAVDGHLFAGDQFIKGMPTLTALPGGSKDDLAECLTWVQHRFPPETLILPGHGEPFTVADLTHEVTC